MPKRKPSRAADKLRPVVRSPTIIRHHKCGCTEILQRAPRDYTQPLICGWHVMLGDFHKALAQILDARRLLRRVYRQESAVVWRAYGVNAAFLRHVKADDRPLRRELNRANNAGVCSATVAGADTHHKLVGGKMEE